MGLISGGVKVTVISIKKEKTNKVPNWSYGDILYCAQIDGKYSLYQICPQEVECEEKRGFDWQLEGYQYTPKKFKLHAIYEYDWGPLSKYDKYINSKTIFDSIKDLHESLQKQFTIIKKAKKFNVYVED